MTTVLSTLRTRQVAQVLLYTCELWYERAKSISVDNSYKARTMLLTKHVHARC